MRASKSFLGWLGGVGLCFVGYGIIYHGTGMSNRLIFISYIRDDAHLQVVG
jgi:Trk-type K+ transport system membrane component